MSSAELAQKLGLQREASAFVLHAPRDYGQLLPVPRHLSLAEQLPEEVTWLQAFYTDRYGLEQEMHLLAQKLSKSGQLWVSWPKKSSGVKTDLSDTVIREIGLAAGLVDLKVAAVDPTWSGLKFVYRTKDR